MEMSSEVRLVIYPDGTARRMPAAEADAYAARRGLRVEAIAWDGRRGSEGGPYLSIDLHESRPAPRGRVSYPARLA